MTPTEFVEKWRDASDEHAVAQPHFVDLCRLLGEPDPQAADPQRTWFCFEKGARKVGGGDGWADVWRRGCFGWEYKSRGRDLDAAYMQLLRYSHALESPPLLVVCDFEHYRIHTNWTNTVQKVHAFRHEDLLDAGNRDLLKWAFAEPERLKPTKTRQKLTEDAAGVFAAIATRLRDRGHDAERVAHFVNRLVFCMFAEDVGLLPNKLFQRALERSERAPERAERYLSQLFAAMKDGGEFGLDDVPWFNGGLFDDDQALPLEKGDVKEVLGAARLDWTDIDPSVLGTLFERGLDPDKRSQLGAHYTDRDKIMLIVSPVIVEPLTREWEETRGTMERLVAEAGEADAEAARTRSAAKAGALKRKANAALAEARRLHAAFVERIAGFRVLDPACGSGNFLYLALLALKDIEHRANIEAANLLDETVAFPSVGPEAVKGIEINPYAAELARVSVWIGEIQWMRRNGFEVGRNPILRPLETIECRDALLTEDGTPAAWPAADVIIGNPPFIGNKRLRLRLGDDRVASLRMAWPEVSSGADLVAYWFAKTWEMIAAGRAERAGLVATNSIRGGANRAVLKTIAEHGRIFEAWSDEDWTVDGVAVRVSMVCFDAQKGGAVKLDGREVTEVYADLTAGRDGTVDLTRAARLPENRDVAFQGPVKVGPFDVEGPTARHWLNLPTNPNNQKNADVLYPLFNATDITRRPSDRWIIYFGELAEKEAMLFEALFNYVRTEVKPLREQNRDQQRRENWWKLGRSGSDLRLATMSLSRIIFTPRVSKHRLYIWAHSRVIPDSAVVAIARDDDTTFGILHSRFHEVWSLRMGTWLGKGNDPRYTPSTTFETFPFPEGLTPDIPAADYADDPRAVRIAEAARRLNELRENWLNPPDLVRREPEVVPGYPDRILPVDEEAAKVLKKRTLTNLYNERPAWLDHAHRELDRAVAAAYGWPEEIDDDDVLARLFGLNRARAARE